MSAVAKYRDDYTPEQLKAIVEERDRRFLAGRELDGSVDTGPAVDVPKLLRVFGCCGAFFGSCVGFSLLVSSKSVPGAWFVLPIVVVIAGIAMFAVGRRSSD